MFSARFRAISRNAAWEKGERRAKRELPLQIMVRTESQVEKGELVVAVVSRTK